MFYNPAASRLQHLMMPEFFSDFNTNVCAVLQTTFMQYDADRSGTVEPHELHAALSAFGKSFVWSHA